MNERKKLYDLKNRRKTLLDEAKALVMEGKHESDEYKGKVDEVDNLNGQIKALEDLMEQDEQINKDLGGQEKGMKSVAAGIQGTGDEENGNGYENAVKAFAAAARAGFPASKAAGSTMNEGTNDDGGYTVPEDIVTRVERFRDSKPSLRSLVSVEPVKTNKGRRTHKKRSQQTGFAKVSEGGKIPAKNTPMFSVISYIIQKFAGFFPVTSELLEDSDENITSVLVEWIGDEARVTENKNILAAILKKAAVDITGLDGLKKAVLVDLNAAFRSTAKIVTNANGLYWMSTLKDQNGRDLLTPIPSEKGKMQLACGPVVVPIEDLPNDTLPNDGDKIPFIIGDLKEGIKLFDRKQLTLTSSDTAVAGEFNAFEQDMILTKAVIREDVQQRDDEAYIVGYVDTGAASQDGNKDDGQGSDQGGDQPAG